MGKLLIATTNAAKLKEFKDILDDQVEIVTPATLKITEEPVEDGETFAENSLLKSNFYWQRAQLPTLTDDGGLEIDALGGAPGVHSRRIDGEWRSDEEAVKMILEKVKNIPPAQRTARIKTVLTLRVDRDRNFQAESSVEGTIKASKLDWDPGFPYRAILWIPQFKKFLKELSPEEIKTIGHRRKAVTQLLPYIQQYV